MKNLFLLFLCLSFAGLHANPLAKKLENVVEEKPAFDEAAFKKNMKDWSERIIKDLENNKAPKDIFVVAEKIITLNPDLFLTLAEDISVIIKENPKMLPEIRKQWQPVSLKPIFVGSSGETLYEMAQRLAKQGNG